MGHPIVEHEVVVYNGVRFYRYPNSKSYTGRHYFTPGFKRKKGIDWLHRQIWKDQHGDIPNGYHIHHKDGNTLNNDISNLEAIEGRKHLEYHWKFKSVKTQQWLLKHIEDIRPAASNWHRSDEGREWHRVLGKLSWQNRDLVANVCEWCGETYETPITRENIRFCSKRCKAASRRASGADDEARICEMCGGVFTCNRYNKTRCCGKACAARLWRVKKAAGLQSDG